MSLTTGTGGSGGGGGGGAVTVTNPGDVVDGGIATLGTTTDAGITTDIAGTGIGFLRGGIKQWIALLARIPAALTGSGNFKVAMVESTAAQAVTNANLDAAVSTLGTQTTLAAILAKIIAAPATEATLALIKAKTDNLDVLLSTRTKPADTQPVSAASLPLPTGAATETTLAGIKTGTDKIPASPATDRTTAAAPFATRLSDGSAFYNGATQTTVAAIDTAAGALADAKVITDANGSRNAFLRGLVYLFSLVIDTTNNFLRVRSGADVVTLSVNFTRPNDTNGYIADDTVTDNVTAGSATNLTFTNFARVNAGSVTLQRVQVVSTNNPATPCGFELLLFTTAPATSSDNSPCAVTDAELQGGKFITAVPLVASRPVNPAAGTSGNRVWEATGLNIPLVCAAATRNIIGVLKVTTAYTPIAQERFDITIWGIQD